MSTGFSSDAAAWEESCVPSYCHPNWAAAYVSWKRLFRAVKLAKLHGAEEPCVLDFGASVGELRHLLPDSIRSYSYVEQDEAAATFLESRCSTAIRTTLADTATYDWIFAIDSLEHNDDFAELLDKLATRLGPRGILILSGPTESPLYRLGRSLAGFRGGYHKTTIYEIESVAQLRLSPVARVKLFPGLPLFSLSVWAADNTLLEAGQ